MTQLTIAIAKGRLQAGTLELLANSGLCDTRDALSSRRLAIEDESGRFRFIFVKPMDVPVYVEHGIADCGVVGRDVLSGCFAAPRARHWPLSHRGCCSGRYARQRLRNVAGGD